MKRKRLPKELRKPRRFKYAAKVNAQLDREFVERLAREK